MTHLASGEVILDRLRGTDVDAITAALRNYDVVRWLSNVPWPYGSDDAAEFIATAGESDYAIRRNGQLTGVLRAGRDLGIWLAPQYQRTGIATRAAVLGLSRAFLAGRQRITAMHLAENHRSALLLARLGFRVIGRGNLRMRPAGGAAHPAVRLRLNRADFAARHAIAVETARLRIDSILPADLAPLHAIATRPEVARMLLRFFPGMPMDQFTALFTDEALLPPFRLVVRQGKAVIGSIGIGPLADEPTASIYYFLDPALSGQGLGSEMLQAFLTEIRLRYAPSKLAAELFQDNPASQRLLEKAGFAVIASGELQSAGRTAPAPGWFMEWPARRASPGPGP